MLLRPFACETGLSLYMFFDFFHQSSSFPHTYLVHFACGFIYAWVFLFQMIIRMLQVFSSSHCLSFPHPTPSQEEFILQFKWACVIKADFELNRGFPSTGITGVKHTLFQTVFCHIVLSVVLGIYKRLGKRSCYKYPLSNIEVRCVSSRTWGRNCIPMGSVCLWT